MLSLALEKANNLFTPESLDDHDYSTDPSLSSESVCVATRHRYAKLEDVDRQFFSDTHAALRGCGTSVR